MDPPGTVPLFLSLTSGRSNAMRKKLAGQAVIVAFVVIVDVRTVRPADPRLPRHHAVVDAGRRVGCCCCWSRCELLTGKADDPVETQNVNVALVPLGTPLLAGPGAIVATIVFVKEVDDASAALALALGIVAVHIVLWLFLRYSVVIIRVIKESGVILVTRIAGLLLSAIAVQLIADGVTAMVKAA